MRLDRTADGKPNLSGLWQAVNEAHWDLQAHEARPGAVTQPGAYPYEYARVPAAPVLALGSAGGVPGSVGVVEGDGQIPYTMAFAFAGAARTIHLDTVDEPPAETSMGHSVGRWEGDTLVVEVTDLDGKTWFDRAGNFHSGALRMVERFTPITPDAIHYEVTIEDPNVFTSPWKISMPLYRRLEPNAQLLEYNCVEFVEEFVYGHLRKRPLVTRWEGKTIIVDITRKIPPVDELYEPLGR